MGCCCGKSDNVRRLEVEKQSTPLTSIHTEKNVVTTVPSSATKNARQTAYSQSASKNAHAVSMHPVAFEQPRAYYDLSKVQPTLVGLMPQQPVLSPFVSRPVESIPAEKTTLPSAATLEDVNVNLSFPGISKYRYRAREKDELSFAQGDVLDVYDDLRCNWVRARSRDRDKMGFAPSLYIAKLGTLQAQQYFFEDCSRSDAERALTTTYSIIGSFLLRNASDRRSHVLSVRNMTKVEHFLIRKNDQKKYFVKKDKVFDTLEHLIAFYSSDQISPVPQLQIPCKKLEAPHTIGLSHSVEGTWEIPRSKVRLVTKLGEGNFGEVYKGSYNDVFQLAVKTLKKEKLSGYEFYEESAILKRLLHSKIVRFFGNCTDGDPFYILLEFMANGDLLSYLRKGNGRKLPEAKLIDVLVQIATGMSYLETNKFVHRDLAARNVLVGENNICKISDFGYTKIAVNGFYILHTAVQLPVKWSAPESLSGYKFSHKTDVWSYGIVMTEVIEKGMEPYPGMSSTEIVEKVCKGYVMPRDFLPHCSTNLYKLMERCWKFNDLERPNFATIVEYLEQFYDKDDDDDGHLRYCASGVSEEEEESEEEEDEDEENSYSTVSSTEEASLIP